MGNRLDLDFCVDTRHYKENLLFLTSRIEPKKPKDSKSLQMHPLWLWQLSDSTQVPNIRCFQAMHSNSRLQATYLRHKAQHMRGWLIIFHILLKNKQQKDIAYTLEIEIMHAPNVNQRERERERDPKKLFLILAERLSPRWWNLEFRELIQG